MSLNIKFSYLAENSKFSRSNSYFSILTPTFLRDGFLNSYFQNPSENSENCLIIQSINTVMNIKSTQNTQENVVKHSFIEFSIFHAILQ